MSGIINLHAFCVDIEVAENTLVLSNKFQYLCGKRK